MKRAVIISAVVLLVLLVGAFLYIFLHSPKQPIQSPSGTTFPIASSSSTGGAHAGTMVLAQNDGSTRTVPDFIHANGTVPEPYSQNEYVIADDCSSTDSCTSASAANGFRIVFDTRTQSFNVLLLAEPLRDSRLHAQQFLTKELGITNAELCSLNASVGTINAVNGTFAGEELGFSVCPDSVLLP